MSFDPRSLERLAALGRQLPSPLPTPVPRPERAGDAGAKPHQNRHRVETETDPEVLFHELMKVSPDGTVPPHLMERLRQAESERPSMPARSAPSDAPATATAAGPKRSTPLRPAGSRPNRRSPMSDEEASLYTSFQQLLLEED
jgi:hypothetical protein